MKFPSGIVASCSTTYGGLMDGYFRVFASKGWIHMDGFNYDGMHLTAQLASGEKIDQPDPIRAARSVHAGGRLLCRLRVERPRAEDGRRGGPAGYDGNLADLRERGTAAGRLALTEGGGATDSCDRIAGRLSNLRARVVSARRKSGSAARAADPIAPRALQAVPRDSGVGAAQHGAKARHRRRRARADVADVLCDPGSHTRVGILQCRQKRRQCRTEVEFRAAVGEVPPAAPDYIQRHGDIAPHLRIRIAKSTRQGGHARRSEGMELVIDLLTPRLQIRQRRRSRSWRRLLARGRRIGKGSSRSFATMASAAASE